MDAKSQKASLVISTLEALAVLVALQCGETPGTHQTKVLIAPSLTDNRGNGAVLNKLMTTKFPTSAVLMELATYMKKMSLRTVVEWAPREGNREADRFANGQFDDFDENLQMPVSVESLTRDILPAALAAGSTAELDYQQTKAGTGLPEPLEEGEETATRRAPAHCRPLVTVRKRTERMVHFFAFTSLFQLSSPLHRTSLPIPVSPLASVVCPGTVLV